MPRLGGHDAADVEELLPGAAAEGLHGGRVPGAAAVLRVGGHDDGDVVSIVDASRMTTAGLLYLVHVQVHCTYHHEEITGRPGKETKIHL